MKNVLVPTDFTDQALELIDIILQKFGKSTFNFLLFHSISIDPSITDMLFFSTEKKLLRHVSSDFFKRSNQLLTKYHSRIHSINTIVINGDSERYFRNVIESNKIDFVLLEQNYTYLKVIDESCDPVGILETCPVHKIMINRLKGVKSETEKIAAEFLHSFSLN